VELDRVEETSMSEALSAEVAAVDPPGVSRPVSTPGGFQVYWVHEKTTEPTDHFRELEPILRRRARAMRLSKAREDLVRELRSTAEIRLMQPE
jgi:hypothetical protein